MATREIIGSCPLDCPDACSWVVTVEEGPASNGPKAVRLRGNLDHPFTAGGLCKKVNPWLQYAVDPSRLMTPLRRIGPKGPQDSKTKRLAAFEPISWDEALDEIASRFQSIIDRSGPRALWPFYGTGNVGYLQGAHGPAGGRFWNYLGACGHQVSICSVSGHVGLGFSTGSAAGMDPEDVVHAGVVVIWGANILVSNQHWWPFVEQARANGATIVVIDPVRTRTADRADIHIAPNIGTDGALALGLSKALIDQDLIDRAYLDAKTVGFEEFADSIAEWSLENTAEECGVGVGELKRLVALLGTKAPLAVKFGQGGQRHAGGGQATRVASCLPALLGSFDQLGGGFVYSTSPLYKLNVAKAAGEQPRPRYLAMTNLVGNLENTDDPIDGLFVYGANPVVSNPDAAGVRRAMSRPGLFTIVVDVYPTETVDYADIVLPSTLQHEQYELNESFSHYYLNYNQPAVAAPGQCLPHTEIFRRLATAMNLDDPGLVASDEELLAALLDTPALQAAGVTLDSLADTGWARLPGTASPYQPFIEEFPTPTGRFQFVSDEAEAQGHGRIPNYRPPLEHPKSIGSESIGSESVNDKSVNDGSYDPESGSTYNLVAAASDAYMNSTFAGTEVVAARSSAPPLILHPDDADRDGFVSGEIVVVSNSRGRFEAALEVSDRARPGLAVTEKGWWGMGVNNTVEERDSDMGRGAVYHDNQVRICSASSSG